MKEYSKMLKAIKKLLNSYSEDIEREKYRAKPEGALRVYSQKQYKD